jgi:hypothetical protein
MSADNLARFLGVTYQRRKSVGLTTIGSIDIRKRARHKLRKRTGAARAGMGRPDSAAARGVA